MARSSEPEDGTTEETRVVLTGPSSLRSAPKAPRASRARGPSLSRGSEVGRYLIIGELGVGGMGEVFSAYDPDLDRRVALKLVKVGAREGADKARGRLLREAQALAKLSHPNVVAVYDAGTHGDRIFIAMEYVEGQTLREWLRGREGREQVGRWPEALALMLQAGRGLAAAHAEGMVHRDFKPANVMVRQDGRVRVLDFGLARRFGEDELEAPAGRSGDDPPRESSDSVSGSGRSLQMQLTQTGMVMGTPSYMAPEQFCGGRVDARTDQFSFCVVLYRALHGIRPFSAQGFDALARAVAEGRLREAPAGSRVPRAVQAVLRRGLSVSPEDRYPTMEALLVALDRGAGQGRRRLVAGGLVLALGLGGAAGGGLFEDAPVPCQGAEERLVGVWDEPRRAAVGATFMATGLPYAEDARVATLRVLDEYAQAWIQARTGICEATRVRGDQSEALMDLRIGCLDGARRDLAAVVEVLTAADEEVVKNAASGVQQLPRLEVCSTLERGDSGLLKPDDPEIEARVEQAREQVARARALTLAGRYEVAEAEAVEAAALAGQTGYRPAIAEASVAKGQVYERKMEPGPARQAYDEALYAAAASGHTVAEAQALLGLLSMVGMLQVDAEAGLRYSRHAEAVIQRLDNPVRLKARQVLYRGNALQAAGRFDRALEDFMRVVELTAGLPEEEWTHLAALNNAATVHGQQGRYREAQRVFGEALALTEARQGPWHPVVGTYHNNLSLTALRLGDLPRAMLHSRRALEIYSKALGAEHPELGRAYHNQGVIQASMGDDEASRLSYQRALEIKARALGPDHASVASSSNNLGDALIKLGRAEEAIPYIEDALRAWSRSLGSDNATNIFGLVSLGQAHLQLGQPDKALPPLRRALVLAEAGEIDPIEVANTRFVTARAIVAAGGEREEAVALAERAKRGYEASERPSAAELAALERWLAEHRR